MNDKLLELYQILGKHVKHGDLAMEIFTDTCHFINDTMHGLESLTPIGHLWSYANICGEFDMVSQPTDSWDTCHCINEKMHGLVCLTQTGHLWSYGNICGEFDTVSQTTDSSFLWASQGIPATMQDPCSPDISVVWKV